MSHQSPLQISQPVEAGRQLVQLRNVLLLVEQIAGQARHPSDETLDENARISSAYGNALPVRRRRFDALARETAALAAAGVEALLAHQDASQPPRFAATALAAELDQALRELGRTVRA